MKFTEKDLQQFKEKGISVEQVEKQLTDFEKGFPYIKLVRAATPDNGIKSVNSVEIQDFIKKYEQETSLSRIKFVPASGAATRMFKALFEFESAFSMSGLDPSILSNEAYRHVKEFFDNLTKFAFYPLLTEQLKKQGKDINDLLNSHHYNEILEALLGEKGMNYRNLPKGLISFHSYTDGNRTAVEEHLAEGIAYAKDKNNVVKIHLTVSPEHMQAFQSTVELKKKNLEKKYRVTFEITFSVQKSYTDTIAVDKENKLFRDANDNLVFRPAGHGALLENLYDLDEDIIFIKNIDNVVPDRLREETILYKKALAGILLYYYEKITGYLQSFEKNSVTKDTFKDMGDFLENELCIHFPQKKMEDNELMELYRKKLNRPIRICGMVKNTGEPGGGPFWAENPDGTVSLQIVETSQIDMKNMFQRTTLESSTHFNPVDIVCTIKDYKGNKFDLHKLVDPSTGFISKKSKDGISLKALELPGLWNGTMSDWNTVFIEVPAITFNPVKTVNDLYRPQHQ